jgi:hypothetical protein
MPRNQGVHAEKLSGRDCSDRLRADGRTGTHLPGTLGNKGDTTWLTQAPYNQIYSNRHDMYSMLKSRFAPG